MRPQALTAVNGDRASYAAHIQNAANSRKQYAELHHDTFVANGLNKYVEVGDNGVIVNSASAPSELKTNGSVRHEDFLMIGDRITEIRRKVLNGIDDLITSGLSFGASITDQLIGFENVNDFQDAEQDMNPSQSGNNDTNFETIWVPNPVTHSGFSVPFRQEGFDYKRSVGMGSSVRMVSERLEKTLFQGNADITVNYGGSNNPIYGYTTHPDRGTGTVSDWSNIANIEAIVPELIVEIASMESDQGSLLANSLAVYVSPKTYAVMQNDYKAATSGTVMRRVMEIDQIKHVKSSPYLADTECVLVELDERTIQLGIASDIISIPHMKTNPLAPQAMTTYAAMVHCIKSDQNGKTGIRHLS